MQIVKNFTHSKLIKYSFIALIGTNLLGQSFRNQKMRLIIEVTAMLMIAIRILVVFKQKSQLKLTPKKETKKEVKTTKKEAVKEETPKTKQILTKTSNAAGAVKSSLGSIFCMKIEIG